MNTIRIVIADDHPIFLKGLQEVIEVNDDMLVIGAAANGKETMRLVTLHTPDIVITDIDMPHKNGLEVAAELQENYKTVNTIILTVHKEKATFDKAMDLGVKGYVLKENAVLDIVNAIYAVTEGKHFISPAVSEYLLNSENIQTIPGFNLKMLTLSERRVLQLVSESKMTKEIAATLFLSERTVSNHRANISRKLGLKGSNSLLLFAIKHKELLKNE